MLDYLFQPDSNIMKSSGPLQNFKYSKCLVTTLDRDYLWAWKLTGYQFWVMKYDLKYYDDYLVPTSQVHLCPDKTSYPYASYALSNEVSIDLPTIPQYSHIGDFSGNVILM